MVLVDLVTGGSGFIGSHVVDKLKAAGRNVRILDKAPPLRQDVEWQKGDLTDYEDVLQACTDVETIYHLAAIADVNVALTDPLLCISVNELGTTRLVQAASSKEVDRIVLASSTWVYGKLNVPVDEEMLLPPPDSVYTKTKIGQEHLITTLCKQLNVPYTILRYDIPYGPRMRSNMAIAIFVRRVMSGQPISVFGDGEQGRCWVYVEDLAEGNLAAGMNTAATFQTINLAGTEFVTINQIVTLLGKRFGASKIIIEKKDERPGDFRGVITKIEKARSIIGWQPKVGFERGLNLYIDWLLDQKKND